MNTTGALKMASLILTVVGGVVSLTGTVCGLLKNQGQIKADVAAEVAKQMAERFGEGS